MKKHLVLAIAAALACMLLAACSGGSGLQAGAPDGEIDAATLAQELSGINTAECQSLTVEMNRSGEITKDKLSADEGLAWMGGASFTVPMFGQSGFSPYSSVNLVMKMDTSGNSLQGYMKLSETPSGKSAGSPSETESYLVGDKVININGDVYSETDVKSSPWGSTDVSAGPKERGAAKDVVDAAKDPSFVAAVKAANKTTEGDKVTYTITYDKDAIQKTVTDGLQEDEDNRAKVAEDPTITLEVVGGEVSSASCEVNFGSLVQTMSWSQYDIDSTEVPEAPAAPADLTAADLPGTWNIYEHQNPDPKLALMASFFETYRDSGYMESFLNMNEDGSFELCYLLITMRGTWQMGDDGTLTFTFPDGSSCQATTTKGIITLTDDDETLVFTKSDKARQIPDNTQYSDFGLNYSIDKLRDFMDEQTQNAQNED